MNLDSDTWIAGQDYTAAPTCVTCHMGAAGKIPATHDVGMRNAWSLNTPVSKRQYLVVLEDGGKLELPDTDKAPKRGSEIVKADGSIGKVKVVATPERRRQIMSMVCLECHAKSFTEGFMDQFDNVVELYNAKFGEPAAAIMADLYDRGLLTPLPFDEPLEFTYWELWHDEGARARHGASMASPNHAWWEGMYVVGRNFYSRFLPEARAVAGAQAAEIVDARIAAGEHHAWLRDSARHNPILGYEPPPEPEPEAAPAVDDAGHEDAPEDPASASGSAKAPGTATVAAAGSEEGGDD
jgi:hypothetical protein